MPQTSQFNQILDMIDSLPTEDQEELLTIARLRQVERRRKEIAENIAQAHQDYHKGQLFRGTVDDVIAELNS